MTQAQSAGSASAILGAIGTAVLFFNSYALQGDYSGVHVGHSIAVPLSIEGTPLPPLKRHLVGADEEVA